MIETSAVTSHCISDWLIEASSGSWSCRHLYSTEASFRLLHRCPSLSERLVHFFEPWLTQSRELVGQPLLTVMAIPKDPPQHFLHLLDCGEHLTIRESNREVKVDRVTASPFTLCRHGTRNAVFVLNHQARWLYSLSADSELQFLTIAANIRDTMYKRYQVMGWQPLHCAAVATPSGAILLVGPKGSGKTVLLVSAELDEIMALSDRIAVMYKGKIIDIVPAAEATREKLGLLMAGVK